MKRSLRNHTCSLVMFEVLIFSQPVGWKYPSVQMNCDRRRWDLTPGRSKLHQLVGCPHPTWQLDFWCGPDGNMYIYIYTYYVLLCTVLYIDDVGINLWDKDILEPLTPVSPGSERERPSHHQPRPASKSQCLWSSHGQVQLGAGTMTCGSTSLRTRCYHNVTIIWTIYSCINMSVCVRGSESASMNSMDKYGLWLISAISININQCSFCFTLDFGGSSSGNIQVSQKRLHAQRGRYFCKARRLELKGRSLFAQEAT